MKCPLQDCPEVVPSFGLAILKIYWYGSLLVWCLSKYLLKSCHTRLCIYFRVNIEMIQFWKSEVRISQFVKSLGSSRQVWPPRQGMVEFYIVLKINQMGWVFIIIIYLVFACMSSTKWLCRFSVIFSSVAITILMSLETFARYKLLRFSFSFPILICSLRNWSQLRCLLRYCLILLRNVYVWNALLRYCLLTIKKYSA